MLIQIENYLNILPVEGCSLIAKSSYNKSIFEVRERFLIEFPLFYSAGYGNVLKSHALL